MGLFFDHKRSNGNGKHKAHRVMLMFYETEDLEDSCMDRICQRLKKEWDAASYTFAEGTAYNGECIHASVLYWENGKLGSAERCLNVC